MKLLTEYTHVDELEFLKEDIDNKKVYKIKGPFLQAEEKNKNGRIYPKDIIAREVDGFQSKILQKRSVGALDHPSTPTVSLKEASHLIESLRMDGNYGIGISRILNTPDGLIVKNLIDEGILLGVSTRGVGTLKGSTVNEDYKLITVDIVSDPSCAGAFVDGILENKDYYIDESGQIMERAIANLESKVDKNANSKFLLKYMTEFINDVRKSM